MATASAAFIVNPVAGNGAVRRSWQSIERLAQKLFPRMRVMFTAAPGDATRLANEVAQDVETIVAVGGDGTIYEIVNGLFSGGRPVNPEAAIGVVSLGTATDLVKSLDVPQGVEANLRCIAERQVRTVDVGLLECASHEGKRVRRCFMNIADAGFGGELVRVVNGTTKALGPFVTYLIGLLRTLRRYQNKVVRVRVDDDFESEGPVIAVVVANGQFFGGGMWVAPQAQLDDGLLDVVVIGDVGRTEVLSNIHKLYNGTLETHAKVTCLQGKKVVLDSSEEVLIDADGEQPGMLPATFGVVPASLRLIVGSQRVSTSSLA